MKKHQITLCIGLVTLLLAGAATAGTCGGAVQCQPGDTLTSDHVMWYDLTDCTTEFGLVILSDGITLDGNGHTIDGTDAADSYGILMMGGDGSTITNLTITDFDEGLIAVQSDTCTVSNCLITSCVDGLSVTNSTQCRIANNSIVSNSGGSSIGLYLYNFTYGEVTGNTVSDNNWRNFDLRGPTQNNVIWGNSFSNSATNATGQTDVINNDWNICGIGNYWDDFEDNSGYPNTYVIEGTGVGEDYYPQQTTAVVSIDPPPNSVGVSEWDCRSPYIVFPENDLDPSVFDGVFAHGSFGGRWWPITGGGTASGWGFLANSDTPHPGEVVTWTLTDTIQCADDSYWPGYQWQYTCAVSPESPGVFDSTLGPFEAGLFVQSVFAADLDGDGDLDLATANSGDGDVSVLLNDGSGVFTSTGPYSAPSAPQSVFAADLDGDGDLDLATASIVGDDVTVLLNDGSGSFTTTGPYSAGDVPMSVFAADLDGDGDMDLATANQQSQDVSVLLNDGSGSFTTTGPYSAGWYPQSVFAADLDGDGDLDLATANWGSDDVSVLLNDGSGSFTTAGPYSAGYFPCSVFAADLDGDGDLDLATANWDGDDVSVLLNDGSGSFTTTGPYSAGDGPRSVFAADLDGDGDLDLAIASEFSNDDVSVLVNDGSGSFTTTGSLSAGAAPVSVFAADLDGDGDLDLATADVGGGHVNVLLNHSSSCCEIRGDINHNGEGPDIADLVHLVSYMFQPPSDPPVCDDDGFYSEADINGDGVGPDIADLVHLVSYMFQPPSDPPVPCP